jgi:MFS family permease
MIRSEDEPAAIAPTGDCATPDSAKDSPVSIAPDQLKVANDGEKDLEKAEEELSARFGISPDVAVRRGVTLFCIFFFGVPFWLLNLVELFVKFGFNGDHSKTAWFLATRMTANGLVRALTDNVFGKISDRLGRKPFFLLSTFVGGFVIFFHAIAARDPILLRAWGWISIMLDVFSGLFGVALAGYLKDCVPHQLFNQVNAGPNNKGEKRWTAITQTKLVAMGGMLTFVLGSICMVGVLRQYGATQGLKLNMAIGGIICWIAGIYCIILVPETVDPTYRRANSLRSYIFSGHWIEDANPIRNFQQVYRSELSSGSETKSSRSVKVCSIEHKM